MLSLEGNDSIKGDQGTLTNALSDFCAIAMIDDWLTSLFVDHLIGEHGTRKVFPNNDFWPDERTFSAKFLLALRLSSISSFSEGPQRERRNALLKDSAWLLSNLAPPELQDEFGSHLLRCVSERRWRNDAPKELFLDTFLPKGFYDRQLAMFLK